MIFFDQFGVRLTNSELNSVRRAAARNGIPVNAIVTRDELIQALLDGLSPNTQSALLAFLVRSGCSDTTTGAKG